MIDINHSSHTFTTKRIGGGGGDEQGFKTPPPLPVWLLFFFSLLVREVGRYKDNPTPCVEISHNFLEGGE